VLARLVDELEWFDHVARLDDDDPTARQENVEEFLASAERFQEERTDATLVDFLADIALVSDVDRFDGGEGADGAAQNDATGTVSLMTLHAAKGLEFDAVFVPGCEEELLPHMRALEEGTIEEERRLLYVGMTRAREHLVLTHASTRAYYGSNSWREPSRFLDELPSDVVDGGEEEPREEDVLGAFEPAADDGLSEGDWVVHPHFGTGRLDRLVGSGANARATVTFTRHGTKTLLLAYAKLEPAPRGQGGR
jgi:DNA helicase-2/ATP-dependent DNA helicase PcrA